MAGTERWAARHAEPPDIGGVIDHATLCHEWGLLMEHPAGSGVAAPPKGCRFETHTRPDVSMELPDYYQVLAIGECASPADVKKAYRKAAMRFSPDRLHGGQEEKDFERIMEAGAVLSVPEKRAAYDYARVHGKGDQ